MRRFLYLASLFTVLASPALAQKQEVQRLQVQVATLQVQISDLLRLAQDNQREIRRLNEALAEQTQLMRKLVQDQRLQLESLQTAVREATERLSEVGERVQSMPDAGLPSAGPAAPAADSITQGVPPAAATAPRELYTQAYADYARGNFDLAIQGFQEYLKNYASDDFGHTAQYWIGECLFGKKQYAEAIEAWSVVLRDYPSSYKIPEARYKKGLALEKLGRPSQAQLEFRFVAERYPNTQAGRLAREKLNPQQ